LTGPRPAETFVTRTSASNALAVCTSLAAGRAWSPCGRSTSSVTRTSGQSGVATGASSIDSSGGTWEPRCAALPASPPRASRSTSSRGRPSFAATAAATAPSTNGASDRTTRARRSGSSRSSPISAERTALPRSITTSTPSSDQTASTAATTRIASVPIWPSSSSPPAVAIATSRPPISLARTAVPSASAALCETSTKPTMPGPPSSPGRERPDQEVSVREREHAEDRQPDVDPSLSAAGRIQVEHDSSEPEQGGGGHDEQEQRLDREDRGVLHVLEHLPVAAQAAHRMDDEVGLDHVDTQQGEERDPADGGRHPGAAGSGSYGECVS